MEKFNVDDKVGIKPQTIEKMKAICHPNEIPVNTKGKVVAVALANSKDHPYPFNPELFVQDMVEVNLGEETIVFPARDLMLLY